MPACLPEAGTAGAPPHLGHHLRDERLRIQRVGHDGGDDARLCQPRRQGRVVPLQGHATKAGATVGAITAGRRRQAKVTADTPGCAACSAASKLVAARLCACALPAGLPHQAVVAGAMRSGGAPPCCRWPTRRRGKTAPPARRPPPRTLALSYPRHQCRGCPRRRRRLRPPAPLSVLTSGRGPAAGCRCAAQGRGGGRCPACCEVGDRTCEGAGLELGGDFGFGGWEFGEVAASAVGGRWRFREAQGRPLATGRTARSLLAPPACHSPPEESRAGVTVASRGRATKAASFADLTSRRMETVPARPPVVRASGRERCRLKARRPKGTAHVPNRARGAIEVFKRCASILAFNPRASQRTDAPRPLHASCLSRHAAAQYSPASTVPNSSAAKIRA